MPLIARPSDIPQAVWTVQSGSAHADHPIANLNDRLAHTLVRSTGTTITFRGTFSGNVTLIAFAFINTNATGITLSNPAGLSQAVTIPAAPLDGHRLDPVILLTGLANRTDDVWDIALTGPSGVGLGVPVPIVTLRDLYIRWEPTSSEFEGHPTIILPTDSGVRIKVGRGVRSRRPLRGLVRSETARTDLLALSRDAEGPLHNFLLIVDDTINDACWVDLTTDEREFQRIAPGVSPATEDVYDVPVEFTEQQKGRTF